MKLGDWVDNMGLPCMVAHICIGDVRVVLVDINGKKHYQDKGTLQLCSKPIGLTPFAETLIFLRCLALRTKYLNQLL